MKSLQLIILALSIFGTTAIHAQSPQEQLTLIFNDIQQYESQRSILDSLNDGFHVTSRFRAADLNYFKADAKKYESFMQRLKAIPNDSLLHQESISKELMLFQIQHRVEDFSYHYYLIPFNAEGGFYGRISWALNGLPFQKASDYEAYLHWLPFYIDYLEDHRKLLVKGIEMNMVAPKIIVNNVLAHLKPFLSDTLEHSPLYRPFLNMPNSIGEAKAKQLRKKAAKIISKQMKPAYQKLERFISTTYYNAAKDTPGISKVTNGRDLYASLAKYYTTLEISPDSIFNIGMAEVKRIRQQMEGVIEEVGFEGSFDEFLAFLRTDPQFYAKTPQELLSYAAWLSKKAEEQLPSLFHKLYRLPFTVAPVPAEIAPTYTAGRYVHGSMKRKKAGTYWVNTYKLEARPLYALPALTLHEAVPGHHLQVALSSELEGLPSFRKSLYFSAFGEGWGLYSEYLGEEMGIYTTPYEQFGRYTYEMWRACRLVVDVGLHTKGWTRKQAVDFLQSNTALSVHEVNTEIDRYIGWPAQALSYKIGEIKIRALRKQAENALGERFDIRTFHEHLLKNGAVTLNILEKEIERYIEQEKAK